MKLAELFEARKTNPQGAFFKKKEFTKKLGEPMLPPDKRPQKQNTDKKS